MALTPEDVSNKRFTTVRLREGYDMTEVDQFLDEVESELGRLTGENDELRSRLHALTGEPLPEATATPASAMTEVAGEPRGEAAAPPAEAPAEAPRAASAAMAPPVETIQVTTTAEASAAATRLLELAGRNADQLVSEARQEAEQIVGTARTEADQLTEETRTRAEAMESESRERAAGLDAETAQRRESLFGDIEAEKVRLDQEIENLRTFEREYRAELKSYFEDQLAALEGQGSGGFLGGSEERRPQAPPSAAGDPAEGETTTRLQELLGDDQR